MKKNILIVLSLIIATIAYAQDQTVNGNLHVSNTSGGNLRIGKIGDLGNKNVPLGGLAAHYNLDFTGYRDVAADQIGARITALRFNRHLDNNALVQKTGLAFYTNPSGWNTGTTDLVERMRITPEGNIGIGTTNPQYKLHIEGDTYTTGWFRVNGNQGLYFQSWGGGFYMTDATWIRTYNNKNFYHNTGVMRTDGVFHVGPNGDRLIVNANGNVGIGITNPSSRLEVAGTIRSKEVKIEATGWSDFVFDKNYDLPKLSEVEKHINEKQHLPGIPSEKEVLENGISVGEMQAKLLQKIEELTLYVITQDKRIKALEEENSLLKNK
ncbi:MAG: shufflon system plasmid conjugative transfer pilus tip adhesin PilV [Prevotella sp.]|jgi:hypothetical protein|nr:shufflon system plasmid conjugative transfer pilus tip adhesin PilV [Prevotella sp.]